MLMVLDLFSLLMMMVLHLGGFFHAWCWMYGYLSYALFSCPRMVVFEWSLMMFFSALVVLIIWWHYTCLHFYVDFMRCWSWDSIVWKCPISIGHAWCHISVTLLITPAWYVMLGISSTQCLVMVFLSRDDVAWDSMVWECPSSFGYTSCFLKITFTSPFGWYSVMSLFEWSL